MYGNTGVTEVARVTGSIYLADPGVDRHHRISISSYHTMKLHTRSFPTVGLTHSVRNFMHPHNCLDSQRWVVACLLTRFLGPAKSSFPWIQFRCRERCGGALMVGSLASTSIVSPQRPPSAASPTSLNGSDKLLLR